MSARQNAIQLGLLNRQRTRKLDTRQLRRCTRALLREVGVTDAELGVTFVGDQEMTRINESFLQHEGSTDVITFDHSEISPSPQPPGARPELYGEIFVCVDEAIRQSTRFHTTWQAEVLRYIVHGVLHLLGHDDHGVKDRRRMKREENRLLKLLLKESR